MLSSYRIPAQDEFAPMPGITPYSNGLAQPQWPTADIMRLQAVSPSLAAAALLACGAEEIIYERLELPQASRNMLVENGLATRQGDGFVLTAAGEDYLARDLGVASPRLIPSGALKALCAVALRLQPSEPAVKRYLARNENLGSAALACIFALSGAGPMPSRTAVRFALARAVLEARFPEWQAMLAKAQARNYRTNSLINALIIGFAGGTQKSITEAETDMLLNAFHRKRGGHPDLAAAIVRTAVSLSTANIEEKHAPPQTAPAADLAAFAAAVRTLAKTMETKPYKGRVAIAEVYDAGYVKGLPFGSLEDFKSRIAEACRAGHLDLERYDIAGPMDAGLRERSRTPFGRDERHFIVNQWI